MLLVKLWIAFLQVGLFSVGGGYAAIPGVLLCTIGCIIPSFCICLLLAHFYYKYRNVDGVQIVLGAMRPGVVALIASAGASIIEKALFTNQIDLGMIEGFVSNDNLIVIPMCQDELVMVCGKTHLFADQKTLPLEALDGQSYVSRESGSTERNQYEQLLEQKGIHLKRSFCSSYESLEKD